MRKPFGEYAVTMAVGTTYCWQATSDGNKNIVQKSILQKFQVLMIVNKKPKKV